jgi:hypothetical protein
MVENVDFLAAGLVENVNSLIGNEVDKTNLFTVDEEIEGSLLIGNEVGEMKSFMIEVVEGVLLVETVE